MRVSEFGTFYLGSPGRHTSVCGVLRVFQSDVFKILLYVGAALVLGAALTPVIYNVGMGIAEVTKDKETNGVLSWLGKAVMRSADNYPRFFDRSLLLAAVLLLPPLIAWLKVGRGSRNYRDTPWSLRLPDSVIADDGQPLRKNPGGSVQLVLGWLIAGGLLLFSGWVMIKAGFFIWRDASESAQGAPNPYFSEIKWGSLIRKSLPTALVVSVIEEILFRGVLLGIFLRALRPMAAIVSLSFLFAFVHFLEPPLGATVPDPEAWDAGFTLLGQIMMRFTDPLSMVGRFLILFAVGVVLGFARWRTASLWLPIGLHAGWIFCYQLFKGVTWPVVGLPGFSKWLVGETLMEGLLPLTVVVITGIIVALMTVRQDVEPELDD